VLIAGSGRKGAWKRNPLRESEKMKRSHATKRHSQRGKRNLNSLTEEGKGNLTQQEGDEMV